MSEAMDHKSWARTVTLPCPSCMRDVLFTERRFGVGWYEGDCKYCLGEWDVSRAWIDLLLKGLEKNEKIKSKD